MIEQLVAEYVATGDARVWGEIVAMHEDVVALYARRHAHRGVPAEDLRQVARMALMRAVDRFDPEGGLLFSTFAGRTIDGELKRHFRDKTWAVRPPRRAQEAHLALRHVEEELSQRLARPPTVAEFAIELGESVDRVREGLAAGAARVAVSLDQPMVSDETGGSSLERTFGSVDPGFDRVDLELLLAELLGGLDERDRLVVRLRFFDGLSQGEVARRIGTSQSYVSRILQRVLLDLRDRLSAGQEVLAG